MNEEINLIWMYPDILDLHGDRGNVMAFDRLSKQMGIQLNIKRINTYDEEIDFDNTDIIFFSSGELKSIKKIIEVLKEEQEQFNKYIDEKKFIILIGSSGAIFAKQIISKNEERIEGLGFLDISCKERETVIGDDIYITLDDGVGTEIIGQQIQMLDINLEDESLALGKVNYGYGNNGNKLEGAKQDNVIFTNVLGPVFVKNPWWIEQILRQVARKKDIKIEEKEIDYTIEVASYNTCKKFIEDKMKKV